MTYTPLWIVLLIAVIDWLAVAYNWRTARFLTKPGVLLVLLIWMGMSAGTGYPVYFFLIGLAFSIVGDVILLLPARWLIAGLVAFLFGYGSYILGFNYRNFPLNLATPFLAVLVFLPASQLYRWISAGLAGRDNERLRIPFLVFTLVISLMVLSALLTLVQPEWRWLTIPSWLVSAGAILLMVSDSLLALGRFSSSLAHGDLLVIALYHLGQILIATGVIFNFTVLASQ